MPGSAEQVSFLFGTPKLAEDDDSGFGLSVLHFHGEEGISHPYWFRLSLRSRDPKLDFSDIVNQPGRLTLNRGGRKSYIHGVVAAFEQGGLEREFFEYRALLRPRLWALSLTHRSRVFQHKSVPEIVRQVLEDHGVPHTIELRESYEPREYLVQYNETDLDFVHRLLTHEGIRYTFEQSEKRETVLLYDSRGQDPWVEGPTEVPLHAESGMAPNVEEWISDMIVKEQAVPGKVVLKDYNYREPSADLTSEDEDSDGGAGEVYEYGHHFKDRTEGKRLAKVRREEFGSHKRLVAGRGNAIGFRAGHRFTLTNHYRDDLNEDYLVVRVRHMGHAGIHMAADQKTDSATEEHPNYRNEFGSAPARVSFRTPRLAMVENFFSETFFDASFESTFSKAFNVRHGDVMINVRGGGGGNERHGKFLGLMTARIRGDGSYGAIDEEGRYKVQMPYDREEDPSRPLRAAQPYGGIGDAGFHFPTHKGNEVLFGCVDGDPDRPVMLGVLPNPEHPSPVTSENASQHIFQTTSDNRFIIEDKEDHENILLYTPHGKTLFSMGNDAGKEGVLTRTENHVATYAGKSGMLHTSGGLVLSAWPKDDKSHASWIAAWLPALKTLLQIIVAYAKEDPKIKRKTKTFKGQVEEAAKANLSNVFKFDFDELNKLLKDHSQLGTLYKLVGDAAEIHGKVDQYLMEIFQKKDDPGILLTALGDIRLMSKNGLSMTAGEGATLNAKKEIKIASADESIGLVASDGLSLFTTEGVLSIDNKKDDVTIKSAEKGVLLRAKKNLILDSLDGHVIMRAEGSKSNLLMAGQEAHLSADDDIKIVSDKEITLECGQSKMTLSKNGDIKITGNNIVCDGKKEVELKVGMNVVRIDNKAILIEIGSTSGIEMNVGKIGIDAPMIDIEAQAQAKLSGAMVETNGKGINIVKGGIVKVN